jgi:sarcosine reductase
VTYLLQRHALCAELVKRHGRDLAFLGVIFFHSQATSQDDKERSSSRVIKLLQSLGAQAVLITGLGGGNLVVDLMMICERAERAGIPSTLLMTEMVAASDDTGVFVDFVREADAIVNVGNYQEMIQLPGVSRVLGGSALIGSGEPAGGELRVPMACLVEATSMVGAGRTVARAY